LNNAYQLFLEIKAFLTNPFKMSKNKVIDDQKIKLKIEKKRTSLKIFSKEVNKKNKLMFAFYNFIFIYI